MNNVAKLSKKKKKERRLKIMVGSVLGISVVANYFKNLLLGTKIKRALFTASVGTLFLYNSCGDDIAKNANYVYNKLDTLFNNESRIKYNELKKNFESLKTKYRTIGTKKINASTTYLSSSKEPYKKNSELMKYDLPEIKNEATKNDAKYNYAKKEKYWYVVKPGDTIEKIANKFMKNSKHKYLLLEYNKMNKYDKLILGSAIKIPESMIKNYDELRSDPFPMGQFVFAQGKSFRDKTKELLNTNNEELVSKTTNAIINYNLKYGKNIFDEDYMNEKIVVYAPFYIGGVEH